MMGVECQICGAEMERDGCPHRVAHVIALREAGFKPDPRGAPNRLKPHTFLLGEIASSNATWIGRAISNVIGERLRQDEKWGEQNHDPDVWFRILGEEMGEVAKAINDSEADVYRCELIQVAAVAVAAIESFDRARG